LRSTFKALAAPLILIAVLPGCKVSKPAKAEAPSNDANPISPAPAPVPAPPTSAPAPGTGLASPTLAGLTAIASNFDINSELIPSSIPGTMAPDFVGAFRFVCMPGQLLRDDPIVFPGQPGKSHLHQFYGNTGADANSTYSSLRNSGQSTCMSPLNRSAYWQPAMLDGTGNAVRPDYVNIYYKRRPISDPKCNPATSAQAEGICVELPNGLKFVFGFDMLTDRAPSGAMHWVCLKGNTPQGTFSSIPAAAASCPPIDGTTNVQIGVLISAPACWDGKNLDSPNHRDHVSYASYGTWGYKKCPSTHPYVIPTFTMGSYYTVTAGDNLNLWKLSSDDMHPNLPHGSTFHADFWMAWDATVKKMWHDGCINQLLSCNAGNLGNGKAIRQSAGFSWKANPRLVPAA